MRYEFAYGSNVNLVFAHINNGRRMHTICPTGGHGGVHQAECGRLELLEEELGELLVLLGRPYRLGYQEYRGMERRIERVKHVGDEGEEAWPVDDPAFLYGPYGTFFGNAVFFKDNLIFVPVRACLSLGAFLCAVLRLSRGRFGLVFPATDLVRLKLPCFFGWKHARAHAQTGGREALRQAQLRNRRLRARRDDLPHNVSAARVSTQRRRATYYYLLIFKWWHGGPMGGAM